MASDNPELLKDLIENLWLSLRHVFNTDRVLLGVKYLINFGGFLLLLGIADQLKISVFITVLALIALNWMIVLSLRNSRREALELVGTLAKIYEDHGLGKYFNREKAEYYSRRYALWTALAPALLVCAVVVALTIRLTA